MRPLAILTGFVLGTVASITFSTLVVGLMYLILGPKYPQVQAESGPLLLTAMLFLGLTATAAVSFIGMLKQTAWRWVAQAAMWAALVGAVFYFLP